MNRTILAMILASLASSPQASEIPDFPNLSASIVLDAINVEDDKALSQTTFFPGTDRFAVREASLELTGSYAERIDYVIKGGTATCQGNEQFQLLEAGVMIRVGSAARVGFEKSHVLRGFANWEECVDQLTAEKPNFAAVLAPCHPMGFKADWHGEWRGWRGFAQIALLNGAGGSLEGEHDHNLGLHLDPPVPGLTVSAHVNDVEFLTGEWGMDGAPRSADGSRWGLGLRWTWSWLELQGEYLGAEGFPMQVIGPASADADDRERDAHFADHRMTCAYLQGGVHVNTGWSSIPRITPYARYQYWDHDRDAPTDEVAEYLTLGARADLAGDLASIRIDYERPLDTAESLAEEAARLIVRFQIIH
jgi:hypothetical protein